MMKNKNLHEYILLRSRVTAALTETTKYRIPEIKTAFKKAVTLSDMPIHDDSAIEKTINVLKSRPYNEKSSIDITDAKARLEELEADDLEADDLEA